MIKFFKKFFQLRKKRHAAAASSSTILVVPDRRTDVLDVNLVDKETTQDNKKTIRQYTKKIVSAITILAGFWITWSYVLATIALITYQNADPLSTLSEKVCEVIVGVVISYCIKAFLETFSERSIPQILDSSDNGDIIEQENSEDIAVG